MKCALVLKWQKVTVVGVGVKKQFYVVYHIVVPLLISIVLQFKNKSHNERNVKIYD